MRLLGMRRLGLVMLVVLCACGQVKLVSTGAASAGRTNASSPPPGVIVSPSSSGSELFAMLEVRGSPSPQVHQSQVGLEPWLQWNTVAIVGLDGVTRNEAGFAPLPWPDAGCGGPEFLPSAYVVGDRVFFADGTGAIRSLGPQGPPELVTSFPLISSQQLMSFAVSPDGTKLLATIVTLPAMLAGADPCQASGVRLFAPGDLAYDVYAATAGGPTRRISHQTYPLESPGRTWYSPGLVGFELWGWNRIGPYGTYPSVLSGIFGGPTPRWHGDLWYADPATGKPTDPVIAPPGSRGCPANGTSLIWDIAPSGDYVCTATDGAGYVVRPDGTVA